MSTITTTRRATAGLVAGVAALALAAAPASARPATAAAAKPNVVELNKAVRPRRARVLSDDD